jgi:general secretion pathway protein K
VIVSEFSTDTDVDYIAATNARDEMRAHFLARSGANLAHLVIRVQTDVIDKNRDLLGDLQLGEFLGLFMGAFGGSGEELEDIAKTLGAGSSKELKGLGLQEGSFNVEMTTEDGRTNLNCANGNDQTKANLKAKLEALFYPDAFNVIFQNADAEGWRRDRPTQVAAFMDYVDTGTGKLDTPGASEEYGYEGLDDRYKPKNNYVDTIGELRQVRGVDDRFWTVFGDKFTVYGGCKENVAAIEDPISHAAIIFLSAKNPDDPVVTNPMKLWALASQVAQARQWGMYFDSAQAYADFVKDPMASFNDLLAASGASGGATQTPQNPATANGQPIEGCELDMQKLNQIITAGPRRIYRIEVTAQIGEDEDFAYRKKLTAVWDTQTQNQNMRDPAYSKGAWVFWRED